MKALKWGCGGCLILIALAVLVGGSGVGVAWMQARSSAPEAYSWSAGVADSAADESLVPSSTHWPEEGSTLDLRFRDVAVELVPVEAGLPLTVRGEFDPDEYELVHEEGTTDGGAALQLVTFEPRGSGLLNGLRGLFRPTPELTVEVPVDGFDRLVVDGAEGAGTLNLSGMAIRDADIHFGRGALQVYLDAPAPRPYRTFRANATQGALVVQGLGHASPEKTVISATMGAGVVDARGPWRQDARIEMSVRMGGGELILPTNVEIVGFDLGAPRKVDPEVPPVRLEIAVEGSRENIDVRRKD